MPTLPRESYDLQSSKDLKNHLLFSKSYYVYWNISSNREQCYSKYSNIHRKWGTLENVWDVDRFGFDHSSSTYLYDLNRNINSWHSQFFNSKKLNIYQVQGSVLKSLYKLFCLILTKILWGRHHHHAHFKDEQTKL